MKKLILITAAALATLSSQAVTLFPYFVDVAGDYIAYDEKPGR